MKFLEGRTYTLINIVVSVLLIVLLITGNIDMNSFITKLLFGLMLLSDVTEGVAKLLLLKQLDQVTK